MVVYAGVVGDLEGEGADQKGMNDQLDLLGVGEQDVDGGAVQILHRAQVDGELPVATGSLLDGRGEGMSEGVDIAEVDLPRRDQHELPFVAARSVESEQCGHQVILADK